jgi:HEAT repeat protein
MTFPIPSLTRPLALLALLVPLAAAPFTASAAESPKGAKPDEQQLINVLQSDAAPGEKAITCKRLAVYGSKAAVPALAALLPNPELTSWARIALEAINDPSADEALRAALPKLQGRILIGVINSIGVRRDNQATAALSDKLRDTDPDIAAAAAEALGHIGGFDAAQALQQALTNPAVKVRSAAAYGCVLCAEQLLASGKGAQAAALCDRVRNSDVPKQRQLEAIRGAILARGPDGLA